MKYIILTVLALSCTACGTFTKEHAKTVVNLADKACVLLDKTTNEKTVEQVCATQDELKPYVDNILSARKMGAAKTGAAKPEAKPECPACPACKVAPAPAPVPKAEKPKTDAPK